MTPPRIEVRGEPSFLSAPSAGGFQMALHTSVDRTGALVVTEVTFDDDGMLDVERYTSSRKKLRGHLDRARASRIYAAPFSGDYVAARVHAEVARHKALGRATTPAIDALVPRVPAPVGEVAHPAEVLSPVADAEARARASRRILLEPELAMWLPTKAVSKTFMDELQSKVRSDATRDELQDELLVFCEGFVDAWCTPERRMRLATQLLDAAAVFVAARKVEPALDAVSAADALRAPGLLFGQTAHEISCVMMIFYKLLILHREVAQSRGE